ncbi:hypothetical protein [Xanthomarina sp. GH4-25]|uniref:hypothetical protein n=1 Tax=Xanthomarina sp. GH4-25 TaxID=3349335 RepID=UPI000D683074|nr:hypothetical protein DI383_12235 [Flavobacteriaceae bacterium LYZ1037]
MKNLLKSVMLITLFLPFFGCESESFEIAEEAIIQDSETTELCANQKPQVQLTNNCNLPVSLKIQDQNGILLEFVEELPIGGISEWKPFNPGTVVLTIFTTSSTKEITMNFNYCNSLEIGIDENFQLSTNLITEL